MKAKRHWTRGILEYARNFYNCPSRFADIVVTKGESCFLPVPGNNYVLDNPFLYISRIVVGDKWLQENYPTLYVGFLTELMTQGKSNEWRTTGRATFNELDSEQWKLDEMRRHQKWEQAKAVAQKVGVVKRRS